MNVSQLISTLYREVENRAYIKRMEISDQSQTLLKARLYISRDLFVQIYRNDRFNTTNLALIYHRQRIYARDQLGGVWHRHTVAAPHLHDTSDEGRRQVDLSKFLDEIEDVLTAMGLP